MDIDGIARIDNHDDSEHTAKITVRSDPDTRTVFQTEVTLDPAEGDRPVIVLENVVTESGSYELAVTLENGAEATYEWIVEDDCDDAWVVIDSDGVEVKPLLHD